MTTRNAPDAEDVRQADRYYYASVACHVILINAGNHMSGKVPMSRAEWAVNIAAAYRQAVTDAAASSRYLRRKGQTRLLDGLWDRAASTANACLGEDVYGYPDAEKRRLKEQRERTPA